MIRYVFRFWRGLAANWIGTAGVVLTTSAVILFVIGEALLSLDVVTNAYAGLIFYLVFPGMFVTGLVLIPLGWLRYQRQQRRGMKELLSDRFASQMIAPRLSGSHLFLTIAVFTLLNVLILGAASARMLMFMDTPRFCGTACHGVMGPEWAAYQKSPHARVHCVDCHIGQGAKATVDAKLNGMWQMVSASLGLFSRPIPTPVHNLRPARETCEHCHWPDAFYGDRLKRLTHYNDDEASSPRYTTLSVKVGSGRGQRRGEIHWHVAADNEVRYLEGDEKRMSMQWVEVRRPDGTYHRFTNRKLAPAEPSVAPTEAGAPAAKADGEHHPAEPRVMDCADCHNRATHKYEAPDIAVDRLITQGRIDRSLPFARKNAIEAITGTYVMRDDAVKRIDLAFRREYELNHPDVAKEKAKEIAEAVTALREVYETNVHPHMNVTWNTYPDHLGHRRGPGCFRCHTRDLVDEQGREVSSDCTLCHSILAWDSPEPFRFLKPAEEGDPDGRLHETFRREFTERFPVGHDPAGARATTPEAPPYPAGTDE